MKIWNPKKPTRYAQIKRDGFNILVIKNTMGNVRCFTRSMLQVDLVWHPSFTYLMTRVPCNTRLNCELWKPGHNASYVTSGLANNDKSMHLHVWRVILEEGRSPDTLAELDDMCLKWGLSCIPWFDTKNEFSENCHGRLTYPFDLPVGGDVEGYVMKDSNLSEAFKMKPFKTADLLITAVTEGRRKYTGQVGALVCSDYNGVEVANVSGFTDEERMNLTLNDVGRIIEVKYQSVGTGHRLRHPTFVRFRDDLSKEDIDALCNL